MSKISPLIVVPLIFAAPIVGSIIIKNKTNKEVAKLDQLQKEYKLSDAEVKKMSQAIEAPLSQKDCAYFRDSLETLARVKSETYKAGLEACKKIKP